MPLPKPTETEDRDEFIERCMAAIAEEFPDDAQRAAVCHDQWRSETEAETSAVMSRVFATENVRRSLSELMNDAVVKALRMRNGTAGENKTLDRVEIFAIGKWNGYKFTQAQLEQIAANFAELGERHKVPLKLGHDDGQPLTDGAPALGWVDHVWVEPGADGAPKLFARFVDVPEVVYDAIRAKRYRKVSVELDLDVSHMGRKFDLVLSGVALLGATLPAVNTLADIGHYLSRDEAASVRGQKRATFATVGADGTTLNDDDEVNGMNEELEKLKAELAAQKERTAKFEREAAEAKAAEQYARVKAHRSAVGAELDRAVSEMRMSPAERQAFERLIGYSDDDRVLMTSVDDVKAALPAKVANFSRATTHENVEDLGGDTGDALDALAQSIKFERNCGYAQALEEAMRRKPDLAKAHIDAPGVING